MAKSSSSLHSLIAKGSPLTEANSPRRSYRFMTDASKKSSGGRKFSPKAGKVPVGGHINGRNELEKQKR